MTPQISLRAAPQGHAYAPSRTAPARAPRRKPAPAFQPAIRTEGSQVFTTWSIRERGKVSTNRIRAHIRSADEAAEQVAACVEELRAKQERSTSENRIIAAWDAGRAQVDASLGYWLVSLWAPAPDTCAAQAYAP